MEGPANIKAIKETHDDQQANVPSRDSTASFLGALPDLNTSRTSNFNNRLKTVQQEKGNSAEVSAVTGTLRFPSSLDFERVVNEYTIQATKDRIFVVNEAPTLDFEKEDVETTPIMDRLDSQGQYKTYESSEHCDVPPPPPMPTTKRRRLRPGPVGYTGRTATRWGLATATGLMTGLSSILIVSFTTVMNSTRSNFLDDLWRHDDGTFLIFSVYAGLNLLLALVAAGLCVFVSPEASGSGIPEVKAYLNGVRVKRFTSFRLYSVKIVGTIFAISSGFVIGPEGPLVHIGAVVGASCTKVANLLLRLLPHKWLESTWDFITSDLSHFSRDAERRDLVSIGSAAGFAAAFGAPIGGLLFSLEEASTYFDQSMFFKTLCSTALATFCLAVYHGDLSDYSIISLRDFQTPDGNIFLNRAEELPLYVVVAVGGGALGGLFCKIWVYLQQTRKRLFPRTRARIIAQVVEVCVVSLLTSTLTYWIPLMSWTCRPITADDDVATEATSELDPYKYHEHQFNCARGEINELAVIFFGAREDAIGDILMRPGQFHSRTLFATGFTFFVLMVLTLGIAIPSGIFMPTFLIGTSLGGAAGNIFQRFLGTEISPSTFALLGAAALLAGIQRSTVSLCVILVEGTGHVKVLIPVIITIIIARFVGDKITKEGLYELGMEINKYPYLMHEEKKRYDVFEVKEIMSAPALTVNARERAQTIVMILRETDHHGFPVVDPDTKKILGLVRRDQLVALIECGIMEDDEPIDEADDNSVGSHAEQLQTSEWNPHPGVAESPMMNMAFHIKDDRYDSIAEYPDLTKSLSNDEYDSNAWLVNLRHGLERLTNNKKRGHSTRLSVADDSMPLIELDEAADVKTYATVGINSKGTVYIRWLNPIYKRKWINIASVMNRGCFVVNDFTPVSKAHHMFTALGLRHLVVLGGKDGGTPVGVITRINLLREYIEERTGCELH